MKIKKSKIKRIIAEEIGIQMESFRAYDAGYQTTDDERRADNRKKQKAAEEHAEKMAVARDEEEHGSAMWKWYDASYERHDANAMLDSPIPVSDVREPPLPKGKTEDEQVHGGGFDDRNFEKGADRGMIEKFLGFELPAGETISGALKAAFKKWNKRRLQNADMPGLKEEIATGENDKFKEELWNASFSSLEELRGMIMNHIANLTASDSKKQEVYRDLSAYYNDVLVPRAEREMPRAPIEEPFKDLAERRGNFQDEWRKFLAEGTRLDFPNQVANALVDDGTFTSTDDYKGRNEKDAIAALTEKAREMAKNPMHVLDDDFIMDAFSSLDTRLAENGQGSMIDDAALGEYIAAHGDGDPREALGHLEDELKEMEAMRLEINKLLDDEQEEIEFSKKWNAGEIGEEDV